VTAATDSASRTPAAATAAEARPGQSVPEAAPQQQPPPPTPDEATSKAPDVPTVGDLLVAPTRIVLEGSKRTAEVTLINIGEHPATYRISLLHLRMTEEGGLEEFDVATDRDRVADSIVRFSPRQVLLEPRFAQTVRIQLRKPADLAPGEYRSHLLFRAVPAAVEQVTEKPAASDAGLQIRLTPIYGVSIPLFVRQGEVAASAQLTDMQFRDASGQEPAALHLVLRRAGNGSIYGDLSVSFTPRGGREQVVGTMGGVAVYPEVDRRTVQIPLFPPAGLELRNGRLRVVYREGDTGDTTYADSSLALP
jgi:hypothetical protein